MHITPAAQRILKLVFALSSGGPLSRPRLERRSGLARMALNTALTELAQLGLLDAQRLRLTLPGLAMAVACGARSRSQARPAARRSTRINAPIALFSQREPARAVA